MISTKIKFSNFFNRFFAFVILLIVTGLLHAQVDSGSGIYLQGGIAFVNFNESATIFAGGAELTGSDASVSNGTTLGLGIGYSFNSKISAILLIGVPPKTDVIGLGGPVDGVPVGTLQYAPSILAVNYHFQFGKFQPFVGAGLNYTMILKETDGLIADINAENMIAPTLRLGFELMFDENIGIFAVVNQIWGNTNVKGTAPASLGSAPIVAEVKLNPTIIGTGVTYRF